MILLYQPKEIHIAAELEPIDTAQWYPKVQRRDYPVGLNLTGTHVDDPQRDALRELRLRRGRQLQRVLQPGSRPVIAEQAMERDQDRRRQPVRQIEKRLVEDDARPLIYFNRDGICWDPKVKGVTVMVNSIYNGWRMEDVWLDQ